MTKPALILLLLLLNCQLDRHQKGIDAFKQENYISAKNYFKDLDSSNLNFNSAQVYLKKIDSIQIENERRRTKQLITEHIDDANNILIQINDRLENPKPPTSLLMVISEIELFKDWTCKITTYINSEDKELNKIGMKIKSDLVRLQIKRFPKLRQFYTKFLDNELWIHDITSYCDNSRSRIINFASGLFTKNINIHNFEFALDARLCDLRFKQARYRWYKGSSGYSYYSLGSKNDSEL